MRNRLRLSLALLLLMACLPPLSQSELDLKVSPVLGMTLDVSPLQGMISHYPIRIIWNEEKNIPVRSVRFLLEHPFWDCRPAVSFPSEKVREYEVQYPAPNQMDVRIRMTSSSVPPSATETIAEMVFTGDEIDFLKALQYPHLAVPEPTTEIRLPAPVYPVRLKGIEWETENGATARQGDLLETFYVSMLPMQAEIRARGLTNFQCGEFDLRLHVINDLPVPEVVSYASGRDVFTIRLDKEGKGRIYFYAFAQGMEMRFALICRDEVLALSPPILFDHRFLPRGIVADFSGVSRFRQYGEYQ